MDKLDQLFARVENLPPAPGVLPRLLGVLAKDDSDLGEVTDMIAVDPALTAKLLQICNSAVFGKSGRVNDVTEAVHQLGFRQVYKVVAVASGRQCLNPSPLSGVNAGQIWRHSVTTAFGAQFLAEDVGEEGGVLFTAGLLHDIGKLILAEVYGRDYGQLISVPDHFGLALTEAERNRYGTDHAAVGGHLLEHWRFSANLIASVQYHHQSSLASDQERLAACIELADSLAHSVELGQSRDPHNEGNLDTALRICGLVPGDIARYQERIRENVEFVEAMCRIK